MKKSFLFISCEEAKHICDKNQYGEATGWEKIKLSIRLSWCNITRGYSKNNGKLTDAIHKSEIDCLKEDEKEKILESFNEELIKHQ